MNQDETPTPAVGYVLLWYGRKHTRVPLGLRPGARQQILMIDRYAKKNRLKVDKVESEYVRQAKGPRDFAVLFRLLERGRSEQNAPVVIIDDIRHLMMRLPSDQITELITDLSPWFERIRDARLRFRLDQIDASYWRHLAEAVKQEQHDLELARKTSRRRGPAPAKQMRRAHARAAQERTRRADESARMIAVLRDELQRESPAIKLTFAAIARAANKRGLKTTRGSEWTSVQVSRALKRLEKSASE